MHADDIIFEHNNHIGITLATPNDKAATIAFTDPEAVAAGWIQYDHVTNNMNFRAANAERMRLTSTGLGFRTTTNPTNLLSVESTGQFVGINIEISFS